MSTGEAQKRARDRRRKHGRFSKVFRRMWTGRSFSKLSPLKPSGQALWFSALTGPQADVIPGLYCVGRLGWAEALGWTSSAFDRHWAELEREGMAVADWKARLVWLPKAVEMNEPESPNVVRAWEGAYKALPECDLKERAHETILTHLELMGEKYAKPWRGLSERHRESLSGSPPDSPAGEASTKPFDNQDQGHKQEKEGATRQVSVDALFDLYAECCPRLPAVTKRTEARRRVARAALKEGTLDEWRQAFMAANRNDFYAEKRYGWKTIMGADQRARWLDEGAALAPLDDRDRSGPLPLPKLPGGAA